LPWDGSDRHNFQFFYPYDRSEIIICLITLKRKKKMSILQKRDSLTQSATIRQPCGTVKGQTSPLAAMSALKSPLFIFKNYVKLSLGEVL
jgi:hypothetical protein